MRSQQGGWRQQPARKKENQQWCLGATERQYFNEAVRGPRLLPEALGNVAAPVTPKRSCFRQEVEPKA